MNLRLKTNLMPLFCLMLLAACNRPYSIQGTLPSTEGTDTVWAIFKGPSLPIIQPIAAKNGSFSLKVENDSIDLISLISAQMESTYSFIPVKGESCTATFTKDQGLNVEIKENNEAKQYYTFRSELSTALQERQKLCAYLNQLKQDDSLVLYQQLVLRDTLLTVDQQLTERTLQFIDRHPNSPYGAIALADLLSITKRYPLVYDIIRAKKRAEETPQSLYKELFSAAQSSLFSLKEMPFPEFTFKLINHQFRSVNQYKRAAHLLFCFWDPQDSYSCFVAKQLSDTEEEYKNHNTTLLLVAITNNHAGWLERVEQLKLNGIQAIASPVREVDMISDLNIQQLPSTIFLSRDDKILFENLFATELSDSLNAFFARP